MHGAPLVRPPSVYKMALGGRTPPKYGSLLGQTTCYNPIEEKKRHQTTTTKTGTFSRRASPPTSRARNNRKTLCSITSYRQTTRLNVSIFGRQISRLMPLRHWQGGGMRNQSLMKTVEVQSLHTEDHERTCCSCSTKPTAVDSVWCREAGPRIVCSDLCQARCSAPSRCCVARETSWR